jgi:phosphate transport system permease protein
MSLQIFNFAQSPYDDWHRLAWAGSLVLIVLVFIISVAARFATRSRVGGGHGD